MDIQWSWISIKDINCLVTSAFDMTSLNKYHIYHKISFCVARCSCCIDPFFYSLQLEERTFQTLEFYRERQDDITPAGLAFFQSDWDRSVTDFFHSTLSKLKEFTVHWCQLYSDSCERSDKVWSGHLEFDIHLWQEFSCSLPYTDQLWSWSLKPTTHLHLVL
jgi:hypothetical protein